MVSTNLDQRSINVSWVMLDCQDRRGIITMYEVRYTSSDFGNNVNLTLNTTNGDETSLIVDGLEEFTNYTIEVRAHTAVGPGPYSDPIDVRTLADRKHIVHVYVNMYIINVYVYSMYKYECQIIGRYIVVLVCFNSSQWSSD